jgi:hypothetical protein
MPNFPHQNDVQIDSVHSDAICKELGERLSEALGPQNELPPRLLALMDSLKRLSGMKDFSNASFPPSDDGGNEECSLYTPASGQLNAC